MPPPPVAARGSHRRVVLLCAVDDVRELRVGGDPVELRGWLVVLRRSTSAPPLTLMFAPPSLPLIMRRLSSGAIHRSWLSPCGVADRFERLAAVRRLVELKRQHVDRVALLRVGEDVAVVPGALAQTAPSSARPDPARRRHRPTGRRLRREPRRSPRPACRSTGETATPMRALDSRWQPARELLPGVAAVAGADRGRCRVRR